MRKHPLPLAALLLALSAGAALAQPTARVTGNIPVYDGPGSHYRMLGRLADGAVVTLDECTSNQRWCLVTDIGWVMGSYLVGMAAKQRASPVPLLDPLFRDHWGRRGFPFGE
jgi:uncharacterized protein YraI